MAKVVRCTDNNGADRGWMVFCPACQNGHRFDSKWYFNGDMEKPTFSPSMLVESYHIDKLGNEVKKICHSFVQNGEFHYCHDSTHEMRDKVVPVGNI